MRKWSSADRLFISLRKSYVTSRENKRARSLHWQDLNEKQSIIWRAAAQSPSPRLLAHVHWRWSAKSPFSTGTWVSCRERRLFIIQSLSSSQSQTTRLLFIYNQIIFNARNTSVNESFKSVKKIWIMHRIEQIEKFVTWTLIFNHWLLHQQRFEAVFKSTSISIVVEGQERCGWVSNGWR